MKRSVDFLLPMLLLGIVVLGCEPPKPAANAPPPPPGATPNAPPPPASTPAPLPPEVKVGVFAGDVNDLAAQPAAQQPPQPTPSATPPADPNT